VGFCRCPVRRAEQPFGVSSSGFVRLHAERDLLAQIVQHVAEIGQFLLQRVEIGQNPGLTQKRSPPARSILS